MKSFLNQSRPVAKAAKTAPIDGAQSWMRTRLPLDRDGLPKDSKLHCLGCSWALMLLLFVGGVMNLWWIGLLTLFVLLEELAPLGARGGLVSGLLFIGLGIWCIWG